jgi:hypothetical protein
MRSPWKPGYLSNEMTTIHGIFIYLFIFIPQLWFPFFNV